MEGIRRVTIKSLTNGITVINLPEIRFLRTFTKKGQEIRVDFDIVREAIYDTGFRYMIDEGILWIPEKKDRVDLELETAEQTEPFIKVLNENQILLLLSKTPKEIEDTMRTLTREQALEVAEVAIEKEIDNLSTMDVLKKVTGKDVLKAITLNKQANLDD